MFFPVQSIGFLLCGLGILAMLTHKQQATLAVAPPFFSGTFVFVALMVSGLGLLDVCLMILASKLRRKWLIILLVLSFVCCLGMGYLSSKDFAEASMNWIAEGVNVVGQGLFMLSALLMSKAGLKDLKLRCGENA